MVVDVGVGRFAMVAGMEVGRVRWRWRRLTVGMGSVL
ncbi:uncharacterized protein G2W53_041689 [Senna tora]|uniref:Uncharacterized protein n=1 Tax=Senna tora TaxID=362788 RepID=A0A834VY85_9FABA|nr:uncharacterized protein G2W53_041689 [Senna tora]